MGRIFFKYIRLEELFAPPTDGDQRSERRGEDGQISPSTRPTISFAVAEYPSAPISSHHS